MHSYDIYMYEPPPPTKILKFMVPLSGVQIIGRDHYGFKLLTEGIFSTRFNI